MLIRRHRELASFDKLGALALMLIGVVATGAVLDWQDEWDRLTTIRAEESQLKESLFGEKETGSQSGLDQKAADRNTTGLWRIAQNSCQPNQKWQRC